MDGGAAEGLKFCGGIGLEFMICWPCFPKLGYCPQKDGGTKGCGALCIGRLVDAGGDGGNGILL
jgi:hypothetical protein